MSGAIRSRRRFTYEEVDEYLADPEGWRSKLDPKVHALLGRMQKLAAILRARRFKRGGLELTMPEVKVDLDADGRVEGAHLVENTESHRIIEDFMLAANEAVAEYLEKAELQFIRRVHMAPDPRKLKALTEFVTGMGYQVESLESRFELQKLLAEVHGAPEERAVNFALLRSLQRAVYSPEKEGHYALASDCYTHFTSPIRRYPDLTIHRLLDSVLRGKKPRNDFGALAIVGEHCSDRERRAEAAERELTKVKLLDYLSSRIGLKLEAVVTGVEEFGLFAQGVDLPAEGLIHISSLQDDFYRFDRGSHTLTGNRAGNRYQLGDHVTVSVARVDVDRRELDFRIVAREKSPARKSRIGSKAERREKKGKAKGKSKTKPKGKRRK
jgi:ribonuclease R